MKRSNRPWLAAYAYGRLAQKDPESFHSHDAPYAEFLDESLIPTLHMTATALGKMIALIQECDIEIGWIAACERDGLEFSISDVFVPGQECSFAHTRITKDGMANLYNDLIQGGNKAIIGKFLCWGHSHVDMNVFASGTDERQTRKLLEEHKRRDHYIRLIGNKWGDMFASVYLLDKKIAVHHPMLALAEIPTPNPWVEWARAEIAEKVVREVVGFENYRELEFNLSSLDEKTLASWVEKGIVSQDLCDYLKVTREKERNVCTTTPKDWQDDGHLTPLDYFHGKE